MNIIKKFNKFINESNNDNYISVIINNLVDDFCENYDLSNKKLINKGYCDEFAENLFDELLELGYNEDNTFLLSNTRDDEEPNLIITDDNTNKFYYKNFTNIDNTYFKYIFDPFFDHVWVYHNGKHYDAETPNGVNDFINLPHFQRIIKKYKK